MESNPSGNIEDRKCIWRDPLLTGRSRGRSRQPVGGTHLPLKYEIQNVEWRPCRIPPIELLRKVIRKLQCNKNEPSAHGKLVIQRIDHLGNWLLANWFGVSRPHSWKAIQQSIECAEPGRQGPSREAGLFCCSLERPPDLGSRNTSYGAWEV